MLAVAVSAFAFVTAEFLPVGLLPQIARDLGVSPGVAGLMVTTPGVMAAIFAPTLIIGAGRMDRPHVFLLLTAVLFLSNVVCTMTNGFAMMLVGRAMLGAALGGFWIFATTAAALRAKQRCSQSHRDHSHGRHVRHRDRRAAGDFHCVVFVVAAFIRGDGRAGRGCADCAGAARKARCAAQHADSRVRVRRAPTYTYIAPLLEQDFSLRSCCEINRTLS